LRNVIYNIRRTTTGGDLATPAPDNPDRTAPAITTVAASQNGSTAATVTWTTNKPTLGFVAWGSTSGTHFGWSPLESSYSTSHSLSLANLPTGQQIYFVVRAKDQAGNQSVSAEQGLPLR